MRRASRLARRAQTIGARRYHDLLSGWKEPRCRCCQGLRAVPAPRARQPPQAGLLTTSPTSETRFEVARDRFDTGGVAFGASLIHIFWISSRFSCSCCPRRASIKLIVVSAMLCALCAPKHSIDVNRLTFAQGAPPWAVPVGN